MKTRVLLADSHACVRDLVELALRAEGSCHVVGHLRSGNEVLERCKMELPEILITEAQLPDMTATMLLQQIRERTHAIRMIVFTGSQNRDAIVEALEARPHGFVHKDEPLAVFYEVLRAVGRGSRYYSERGVRLLDDQAQNGKGTRLTLSPRERSVLTYLARGFSSKQIAAELELSTKTVDHYRAALMAKLDIHDVAGLTRYAIGLGLVS